MQSFNDLTPSSPEVSFIFTKDLQMLYRGNKETSEASRKRYAGVALGCIVLGATAMAMAMNYRAALVETLDEFSADVMVGGAALITGVVVLVLGYQTYKKQKEVEFWSEKLNGPLNLQKILEPVISDERGMSPLRESQFREQLTGLFKPQLGKVTETLVEMHQALQNEVRSSSVNSDLTGKIRRCQKFLLLCYEMQYKKGDNLAAFEQVHQSNQYCVFSLQSPPHDWFSAELCVELACNTDKKKSLGGQVMFYIGREEDLQKKNQFYLLLFTRSQELLKREDLSNECRSLYLKNLFISKRSVRSNNVESQLNQLSKGDLLLTFSSYKLYSELQDCDYSALKVRELSNILGHLAQCDKAHKTFKQKYIKAEFNRLDQIKDMSAHFQSLTEEHKPYLLWLFHRSWRNREKTQKVNGWFATLTPEQKDWVKEGASQEIIQRYGGL